MRTAGMLVPVVWLATAAGCSPTDPPPADPNAGSTATGTTLAASPSGAETPTPATRPGSWTYKSADHGFSLDLPSDCWKPLTKKRFLADFWCRTGVGSPMLAAVTAVKAQTRAEFEAAAPAFKAKVEKEAEYLQKPAIREGKTAAGHPYVYASWCEPGATGSQFVFVATAVVWLADKGVAVTTLFEGQGRMRSKTFRAVEAADFEATAKAICLSPK